MTKIHRFAWRRHLAITSKSPLIYHMLVPWNGRNATYEKSFFLCFFHWIFDKFICPQRHRQWFKSIDTALSQWRPNSQTLTTMRYHLFYRLWKVRNLFQRLIFFLFFFLLQLLLFCCCCCCFAAYSVFSRVFLVSLFCRLICRFAVHKYSHTRQPDRQTRIKLKNENNNKIEKKNTKQQKRITAKRRHRRRRHPSNVYWMECVNFFTILVCHRWLYDVVLDWDWWKYAHLISMSLGRKSSQATHTHTPEIDSDLVHTRKCVGNQCDCDGL